MGRVGLGRTGDLSIRPAVGEGSGMDGPLILSRDEKGPWIFLSSFYKDQRRKELGGCAITPLAHVLC